MHPSCDFISVNPSCPQIWKQLTSAQDGRVGVDGAIDVIFRQSQLEMQSFSSLSATNSSDRHSEAQSLSGH